MYIGGGWGEECDEKLENGMYLSSLMILESRSGCDYEIRQFKQSKGQWRGRPEKAGETWMLKRPEMMAESGLEALLRGRISRGSEGDTDAPPPPPQAHHAAFSAAVFSGGGWPPSHPRPEERRSQLLLLWLPGRPSSFEVSIKHVSQFVS